MRKCIINSFYLYLIFLPAFIPAQWSTDPSENLQVSTWGINPEACSDDTGGVYVLWESFSELRRIYLQRVNRYGYVKWDEPVFVGGTEDEERFYHIVNDGYCNALFTYIGRTIVDTLDEPPMTYIFSDKVKVNKIDSSGALLWGGGIRVNVEATNQFFHAKIISDDSGGAIVIWVEEDTVWSGCPHRLKIQRIGEDGNRLWGASGIMIADSILEYREPMLVSDGLGGAIVSWDNLKLQRISPDGEFLWDESIVNGGAYYYSHPYVEMVGDGGGGVITQVSHTLNCSTNLILS